MHCFRLSGLHRSTNKKKNVFSSTRKNFAALSLHVRLIDASLCSSNTTSLKELMRQCGNYSIDSLEYDAPRWSLISCCVVCFLSLILDTNKDVSSIGNVDVR